MDPRTPSDVTLTGSLHGTERDARWIGEEPRPTSRPDWLLDARAQLGGVGKYLAYEESGLRRVVPLAQEWTRIGRSLSADVRFDDATVSRRHALIVCQPDCVRVLDDRSLNGVYVNGRRVEWSPLHDGDEIAVGRHSLWFLELSALDLPEAVDAEPAGVAN